MADDEIQLDYISPRDIANFINIVLRQPVIAAFSRFDERGRHVIAVDMQMLILF